MCKFTPGLYAMVGMRFYGEGKRLERLVLTKLRHWQQDPQRKPLLLTGAPGVGKTWLLQDWGKKYFANVAYFNFAAHPEYQQFFTAPYAVAKAVAQLQLASTQPIYPEKTLIILDAIDDCPVVINALPAFRASAIPYQVVAAARGYGLRQATWPSGAVEQLTVYPLTFTEFLHACGDHNLVAYLESINELAPLPDFFFHALSEKLKMYFMIGGMPATVAPWAQAQDVVALSAALRALSAACERTFLCTPMLQDVPKLSLLWQSIPQQLARVNKKFNYRGVKVGARAREYARALQWLQDTGLVHKVVRAATPTGPLVAASVAPGFKLYPLDVGLLRHAMQIAPPALMQGEFLFSAFNGALSETFVLQSLLPQYGNEIYYWSQLNPFYAIDFLLPQDEAVIPLALKVPAKLAWRSLDKFKVIAGNVPALRVSLTLANLKMEGDMLTVPLFLVDHLKRLIGMALSEL